MKPYKDPQVLKHYINRIYQAVLEPAAMERIISDLRTVVGAPYGGFQVENMFTHELRQASILGYDESYYDNYAEYYISKDPWQKEGLKLNLAVTPFVPSQKLVPDKIYRESEFYQDWGRQYDLRHAIGSHFLLDDGFLFKINFQRHADQKAFDEEIELFLNLLQPHFNHFVKLSPIFQYPDSTTGHWQQALLQLNRPVWVINKDMQLVFHNNSADEWLSDGVYFSASEGQLLTPDHFQNQQLIKRVGKMTDPLEMGEFDVSSGQHNRITIGAKDRVENFWLSPVVEGGNLVDGLVMVAGRRPLPSITLLTSYHRLTQRQAQVCQLLMQGSSPQVVGQKLNISVNTVRNTLAACFRVLNVKNQSELIMSLFSSISKL